MDGSVLRDLKAPHLPVTLRDRINVEFFERSEGLEVIDKFLE
ncbi:MAG: hypothetical protein WCF61_14945 [Terriglobales bacterium]